ncbi:MAG: chemotaxis protein CheA [Myxococcales bacterium]|nr:chemotaxis protein CheA [Myxococcales bacterium]
MAEQGSDKVRDEFLSESQEIVEQLNRDLLAIADACLGRDPSTEGIRVDPDLINSAFRAVHSLKGLAGLSGVERMLHMSHHVENLLDALRLGKVLLTPHVLDLLFEAIEHYQLICAEVADHGLQAASPPSALVDDFVNRVNRSANTAAALVTKPAAEPTAGDFDLDPGLVAALTEYEEHRLKENIRTGKNLFRILGSFPLMSIDVELENIKASLKPVGEVIAIVPGSSGTDPECIDLEVILGSPHNSSAIVGAVGNAPARVMQVARRNTSPASAASIHPSDVQSSGPVNPSRPPVSVRGTTGSIPQVTVKESQQQVKESQAADGGDGDGDGGGRQEQGHSLKSVSQTVRVDIRKLDVLMNIVGELALTRSGMQVVHDELRRDRVRAELARALQDELRALTRKLDELQAGILAVRMVPLQQVFDKLSRVVRRMSREAIGKDIHFVVSGGDTKLDKLIIEELSDPLMHLIRNAIDHGIEDQQLRLARGKPAAGTVAIGAEQRGNHVVLEIEDDGNGIDTQALVQRAIARGQISEDQARDMTRHEMYELMFLPGLSTRAVADETSGRGVGMDVVKTNISRMAGIIEVDSEPGHGTRLTITLPITLAIIQALVIRAAGRTYAIPLNSVMESLMLDYKQIRTIERREVITLRDQTLPLVRLEDIFSLQRPLDMPEPRNGYVVVVALAQNRLGLLVDDLVGQQDIVIKSLGKTLQGIPGIAGATELGGQQTALVLDVRAVAEEAMPRISEVA